MDMPARQRPVSVGVLLDNRVQERWVAEALRQALAVPGVNLGAVALLRGARLKRGARFFSIVDRLDRGLRCRGEWLFTRVDAIAGLAAPKFAVQATRHDDGWSLDAAAVRRLRKTGVDVWLCFAELPARRPLPGIAGRGVWSLEIGCGTPAAQAWAGAAEIGASNPVTMTGVADWMQPPGTDLYRTFGSTFRSSIRRNRLAALRKGLRLFARLLAGLAREGDGWQPPRHALEPVPARYPVPSSPTIAEVTRLCGRIAANVASNRWALLRWREQWRIAYRFFDGGENGGREPEWRYLIPPLGRLWADPFVVRHDNRQFVFFEEVEDGAATEKGIIMATEIFPDAEPGPAAVALKRPYHLSYPFVFRWNGAIYMLPETGANRTVELYRCEEFPLRWSLDRVLIGNIAAYDATLWQASDRWWMFVNVAEPGADCNDELHLYWSRTPLGPWVPHHANPVVTDVRRARSAGPLFTCAGTLYRPSQDSSRVYGQAVSINRIDVLDEDDYRETPVNRLGSGAREDVRCVHTLGGDESVGVIDVMVRRARW